MTNFTISIVSDTVCPWCYVGKKKLDSGIAAYRAAHPNSTDTFTTNWYPYYLNPAAPKQGVDKMEYYHSKFGAERAKMMIERISGVGQAVGIKFDFGGRTGATRDSHRLIQLAKSKGPEVQDRLVQELFTSYFEKQGDITSHEMLLKAGVSAGIDELEVKQWLANDKGGLQVDREVMDAQARGISGVPNFVMQGRYEIGGAQEADSFVRVFERIKELEG